MKTCARSSVMPMSLRIGGKLTFYWFPEILLISCAPGSMGGRIMGIRKGKSRSFYPISKERFSSTLKKEGREGFQGKPFSNRKIHTRKERF
jgi:hypothetical protein